MACRHLLAPCPIGSPGDTLPCHGPGRYSFMSCMLDFVTSGNKHVAGWGGAANPWGQEGEHNEGWVVWQGVHQAHDLRRVAQPSNSQRATCACCGCMVSGWGKHKCNSLLCWTATQILAASQVPTTLQPNWGTWLRMQPQASCLAQPATLVKHGS